MKRILKFALVLLCAVSLQAQGDLHLFSVNNKDGAITPSTIESAFTSNGFTLGINSEMNGPFTKQFGKTTFKVFTLLTVYHTKLSKDLLGAYPQAGVFTPMGVGIYQNLNDDTLHVSILTSQAQAKILGTDDKILKEIEAEFLKVLTKALPNAKHSYSEDSLKESRALVTQYELELDEDTDPADAKADLEMSLESGFEPLGFVMPGFIDVNEELTQEGTVESPYDFYDTYSICKLKVIYTVAQTRPEASAFAPCTTMVYKKKGEDKVVIGFPAVYNWMSSAKVQDTEAKAVLMKAQKDFESILKSVTE